MNNHKINFEGFSEVRCRCALPRTKNQIKIEDKAIKAHQTNDVALMKEALAEGLDPHFGSDNLALFVAARGSLEMLKLLIEAGFNIHKGETTALQFAAQNERRHIVEYLLSTFFFPTRSIELAMRGAIDNGYIYMVHVIKDKWCNRFDHSDINMEVVLRRKPGLLNKILYNRRLFVFEKASINVQIKNNFKTKG